MNYKNPAWLLLILMNLFGILWFSSTAGKEIYNYYTLSETTNVKEIHWFVERVSFDDYKVGAEYSYLVKNNLFEGKTLFKDKKFRNPLSADDELKVKANQEFLVFYDPTNLYHSSLQKSFPTKECVSITVLFLLLLYFIGLGIYAKKYT